MKYSDPGQESALIGYVEFNGLALLTETLPAEAFTNPDCRLAWECALALHAAGRVVNRPAIDEELARRGAAFSQGGGLFDSSLSMCLSVGPALNCLREIRRLWNRRRSAKIGERLHGGELSEAEAIEELRSVQEDASLESLGAMLESLRFDPSKPPPAPRKVYEIAHKPFAHRGNLVAIAAKIKSGKTAFCQACIASVVGGDGDTLHVNSVNEEGFALLHFDSEQSDADHHLMVAGALCRVRARECPPWLLSYRITVVPQAKRFELLEFAIKRAKQKFKGIHSIILDGVADFIRDPNDPAEAFAAVERLHQLAIEHDTVILGVIHINHSSDTAKTRGHLGSQLERKAESNLIVEKDDHGISTVYSTTSRHAFISKQDGPRFRWDDKAGMHLSHESERAERAAETEEKLHAIAEKVFGAGGLKYTAAIESITKVVRVKTTRAEGLFTDMKKAGIVVKDAVGFWELKP